VDLTTVQRLVRQAIEQLFEYDYLLLDYDANERSITHKLGEHLAPFFRDNKLLSVDCEYNRYERDPKYVDYPKATNTADTDARTVYPDVIVHQRGKKENNLLVIEVKRSTNNASWDTDLAKLADIAKDKNYEYRFGVFLNISTGPHTEPELWADAIWFEGGIRRNEEPIRVAFRAYTREPVNPPV
jgi:hypothetical protein